MYAKIERLLSQVESESGHGILGKKRTPSAFRSPNITTGIPPLDDALKEHTANITQEEQHPRPPLFELLGASGSGKTQMLYRICVSTAMPRSAKLSNGTTVDLQGHSAHVLLVDIDGKMSMDILAHQIRERARELIKKNKGLEFNNSEEEEEGRVVEEALGRIRVFTPESTHSLVATLALLPRYAQDIDAPLVLLVDGLGANFWLDKRTSDHMWLKIKRATPWFRLQQVMVDTLQQVHLALGCLCVVTSGLFLRSTEGSGLVRMASQESASSASQGSQQAAGGGGQQGARSIEVGQCVYRDHMIPRWKSAVTGSFVLESMPGAGHGGMVDCPVTKITLMNVGGQQNQNQQQALGNPLQKYTMYVGTHAECQKNAC
ncbi:hypothetical protein GGF37_004841 [Kickxella alabastrina]|nr:hypothetical protein GGF37_004841 [Kickxella alabastrina]